MCRSVVPSPPLHFATKEVLKLLGPKIKVEKDPSVAELSSPALCFALYFVFPTWGGLQGQNLFLVAFFFLGAFSGWARATSYTYFFFFYPKVLYFVVENLLRPSFSQTECFKQYSWYLWLKIFFALCPPLPFLKVFEPNSTIRAKLGP